MNNLSVNVVTPTSQRSKKLCFIFWNDFYIKRHKYKNDFNYANDMMHMSHMLANSQLYHNYDRILCYDLPEALRVAKSLGFVHAVVHTPGSIVGRNHYNNLYDFVKDKDYFLIGHILDGKPRGKYLWMHEQCFVINLGHVDKFDFVIDNDNQQKKLFYDYERSAENFHDDYTPHWVKGLETQSLHKNYDWTAHWLNYGLKTNSLLMFPESVRSTKSHMYPENKGHRDTWKGLSKEENQLSRILENSCKVDTQQHLFNNENFDREIAQSVTDRIDTIVVPASGFFGVHAFNHFKAKNIIYYDIDQKTLDFRKKINDEWNGTSPLNDLIPSGVTPFNDDEISKINLVDGDWIKNPFQAYDVWNQYKLTKKYYYKIDIINDYEKFSKIIPNTGNVFVWLDSIYTYSINIWNHKPNKIFESYFGLVYLLKQYQNRIWIDCKEPTGQYRCYEVHEYSPDAVMMSYANYRKYV